MAVKLTSQIIDATPTPDKPLELRDAVQQGLVLRIQPGTGLKTWYAEYRRAGRKSRVKLGQYPTMPVLKARNEAAKKRGDLLSGKDPGEATKRARRTDTLRTFITDFYRPWVEANRKSGKGTANRIESAFRDLLDVRLTSLTAKDFARWAANRHSGTLPGAAGPASSKTTNTDLRTLRAALQWGVEHGHLLTNPAAGIKREKEKERPALRALSDDEERAILGKLELGDPFRALVIISLDSGARRAEALTLDWAEVNLKAGTILLLDGKTKSGKRRELPLTPRARKALEGLQGGAGRVFDMKPAEVFRRWKATCDAAGIVNRPRWHDLRASFATRLVNEGVALHLVMALLGHSSLTITQGYLRMDNNDLTGAIAALAARNEGTK